MRRLKQLKINTENHISNVYVNNGILKEVAKITTENLAGRILLVTDENVDKLYSNKVLNSFDNMGVNAVKLVLPPGEKTKSPDCLSKVYDALGENKMSRTDVIVALGGGVIGDLAGYAAATWQRGMKLVQIPTTLLAQIDSSIGGKTAIDLKWGKNMVGAFKHPDLVFIDPDVLSTLTDEVFAAGMAEMIKYACIFDADMFNTIKTERNNINLLLPDLIYKSCNIKKKVVQEDATDLKGRMILNFGHTVAHVLERLEGFKGLSHGQAVALGMVYITKRSEYKGLTKPKTAQAIADVCKAYNLPVDFPDVNLKRGAEYVKRDKKARDNELNMILLKEIGSCFIYKRKLDEAVKFLGWGDKE